LIGTFTIPKVIVPFHIERGAIPASLPVLAHRNLDAIGGLAYVRPALRHAIRHRSGVLGYSLYWAGDMLTLYACIRAFGADLRIVALVLVYATAYVATALPLPVGGAGGVDAAFALTLNAVGVRLRRRS
jgi:lysylphosphatidylglycerol synthase-like protein